VLDGRDQDVRRFDRVARQRYAEAEFLAANRFTTAAVYLGGYAVECALKALAISRTPRGRRGRLMETFRGNLGHDLEYLAATARKGGGRVARREQITAAGGLPPNVRQCLRRVSSWSTDLRYNPGELKVDDARTFLEAAAVILAWVTGEG
jgi:HEPN domain